LFISIPVFTVSYLDLLNPALYGFNPSAVPTLIVAATILVLGIVMAVREGSTPAGFLFLVLTFSLSWWLACISMVFLCTSEAAAMLWVKIEHIFVFFIPAAVYNFAVVVMRISNQRRQLVTVGWFISFGFILADLFTNQIVGPVYRYWWGFYPKYGLGAFFFLIFFFAFLFRSLNEYWVVYKNTSIGYVQRQRARALLFAFSLGYVGSIDYLAAYAIPVYPFGYVPILLFLVVTVYAIGRYRLVDITPALAATQILYTMNDALLVLDAQATIRVVNRAASDLFGYTAQMLIDRPLAELLGDIVEPRILKDALRGTTIKDYEVEYRPKFNSTAPAIILNVSISIIYNGFSRPEALVCVLRDISEQKRAADRVRREVARAEALLRAAARLNTQLDLDAVLKAVCEETAQALNTPVASVALYNEETMALEYATGVGLQHDYAVRTRPIPYAPQRNISNHSVIVVEDVQTVEDMPDHRLYVEMNFKSVASAAMMRKESMVGRLTIATINLPRIFSDDELALLQGMADQAALAISNARLFAETQRRFDQIQVLREIEKAAASTPDVRYILNVILTQTVTHLRVDAADVLLLNRDTGLLEYALGTGFRTRSVESILLPNGQAGGGRAALERRVVGNPNRSILTNEVVVPWQDEEGFVAYYAAPLIVKGVVNGVIELFHCSPLNPDRDWLAFIEAIAGQAAIAIDNAQLFIDLQLANLELTHAYDATLEGWSHALDLRDHETEGHTQRVAEMALRLARAVKIPEAEMIHIRRGALLHDIGKMGVPDRILLKPGPLDNAELIEMRRHPDYAFQMLSPIGYLRPALDIPYCHHEKWDGTGYPRGLKGEQIPLSARVFSVVDVWDALNSDRPYRLGWPPAQVREYIHSLSGLHFDPQIVDIFLGMEGI
jgi:PAS domain S-box-containing protein/putative nucleotidyltransferase with HDIG domain